MFTTSVSFLLSSALCLTFFTYVCLETQRIGSCQGTNIGEGGISKTGCASPESSNLLALLGESDQATIASLLFKDTPNETLLEKNEDKCFPARASVQVRGRSVRLDDLQHGDRVNIGDGKYSYIFKFLQADEEGVWAFVRLSTEAGALTIAPRCLVYSSRGLIAADRVQRGDYLRSENGSLIIVDAVWHVFDHGMYNPQMLKGQLAIDGFVVRTNVNAVLFQTAAAMFAPLRMMYSAHRLENAQFLSQGHIFVRSALLPALGVVLKLRNFPKTMAKPLVEGGSSIRIPPSQTVLALGKLP